MPPAMATAYVYIEFKRELDEFRQIHEQVVEMTRPGKYVRDAFAGVLGGAAALGAATAYILGFTDKMR